MERAGDTRDKQGLEEILRWFTRVDGKKEAGWVGWIEGLGGTGERFVGKIGNDVLGKVEE